MEVSDLGRGSAAETLSLGATCSVAGELAWIFCNASFISSENVILIHYFISYSM